MKKLLKEVHQGASIGWDLVEDLDNYSIKELKELEDKTPYFGSNLIGYIQSLTNIVYSNLPYIQIDISRLTRDHRGGLYKEDQKKLRQFEYYLNNNLEHIPIKYFNDNQKIYQWFKNDISFMLKYNIPFIEKSFLDMIDFNVIVSSTL